MAMFRLRRGGKKGKIYNKKNQGRAFPADEIGHVNVLREERAWHFVIIKNRLELEIVSYGKKGFE